jgi:hypothetical protein
VTGKRVSEMSDAEIRELAGARPARTPAEELRQAAKLMRERAGRASAYSPGPWISEPAGGGLDRIAPAGVPEWTIARALPSAAAHIAGMHPGVALAVADWLEVKAANLGDHDHGYALAVARAYLDAP